MFPSDVGWNAPHLVEGAPHQFYRVMGRVKSLVYPEGIRNIVPGGIKIPSSEDKSEGGVDVSSPHGKKRAASEDSMPSTEPFVRLLPPIVSIIFLSFRFFSLALKAFVR